MGGVHLPLFASFELWLKRNNVGKAHAPAWLAIADKTKFFVNLAAAVMTSNGAPSAFAYCVSQARDLTCAALPVLQKRAAKLSEEHLRDYCYNPPSTKIITKAQASRRQDAREAAEVFSQLSAPMLKKRRQDGRKAAKLFSQLSTKKRE